MKRIRSTRKPARALILLCVALFSIQEVSAVGVYVTGRIRYWDNEANAYRPLVNAETQIETYNPIVTPTPVLYTDANGEYSIYLGVYPPGHCSRLFQKCKDRSAASLYHSLRIGDSVEDNLATLSRPTNTLLHMVDAT